MKYRIVKRFDSTRGYDMYSAQMKAFLFWWPMIDKNGHEIVTNNIEYCKYLMKCSLEHKTTIINLTKDEILNNYYDPYDPDN